MARTRKIIGVLGPLGLLLFSSCASSVSKDLVRNERLYASTGYQAEHAQTRSVFVRPLRDRRQALEAYNQGIYPVTYTQDDYWERPVRTMLDELFRRELKSSGVFAHFTKDPKVADWVLEPTLLAFHGAIEERVVGRVTKGLTRLHVRVWGPRGADGQRRILRESEYAGPVEAAGLLFVPDPHALAAASFRKAMTLVLADIDRGGALADAEGGASPVPSKLGEQDWAGARPAQPGR